MGAKRSVTNLKEVNLKGKRVFMRVDLNVPLEDNLKITDETRVRATILTIKYLMGHGAKVIHSNNLVHVAEVSACEADGVLQEINSAIGRLLNTFILIQDWIERAAMIPVDGKEGPADVCVIELGGTIGDIESIPFIEALGQFSYRVGPDNFCLIHVSVVPVLNVVGEQKIKPTQHSVRGLRCLGLTPNILACRSTVALEENVKAKLSQFCHVPEENIITLYDVPNIWHIPLLLRDQKAHEAILRVLNLQGVCLG